MFLRRFLARRFGYRFKLKDSPSVRSLIFFNNNLLLLQSSSHKYARVSEMLSLNLIWTLPNFNGLAVVSSIDIAVTIKMIVKHLATAWILPFEKPFIFSLYLVCVCMWSIDFCMTLFFGLMAVFNKMFVFDGVFAYVCCLLKLNSRWFVVVKNNSTVD